MPARQPKPTKLIDCFPPEEIFENNLRNRQVAHKYVKEYLINSTE